MFEDLGLPVDFLPPLGLRDDDFLWKSDLSGLSGLSKPSVTVILTSKNFFSFFAFCFNFFSTVDGINSSSTLITKSSSLIELVGASTFLAWLNSFDANSWKKSAADLNWGFSSVSFDSSSISASASSSPSIWDSASSPNLLCSAFAVSVLPVLECLSNFLSFEDFLDVFFGPALSLFLLLNLTPASLPFDLGLPPLDLVLSAFGGTPDFLVDFCGATISFGVMNSSSSPETSLPNKAKRF